MHFFIGSSPQRRTIYQKKKVGGGWQENGAKGEGEGENDIFQGCQLQKSPFLATFKRLSKTTYQ